MAAEDAAAAEIREGSHLFTPAGVIGVVTNGVPPASFIMNGTDAMVVVSVGKSYNILDQRRLKVAFKSALLPRNIARLAADNEGRIYVALDVESGAIPIHVFSRFKEIKCLEGPLASISSLSTAGQATLIAVGPTEVLIWDLTTFERSDVLVLSKIGGGSSSARRVIGPVLYLRGYANKILVSVSHEDEGRSELYLWNFHTKTALHVFSSLKEIKGMAKGTITALGETLDPSIVIIGISDGTIALLDFEKDEILRTFSCSARQGSVEAVTGVLNAVDTSASRSGGAAGSIFCGCSNGDIIVWDPISGICRQVIENAHEGNKQQVSGSSPCVELSDDDDDDDDNDDGGDRGKVEKLDTVDDCRRKKRCGTAMTLISSRTEPLIISAGQDNAIRMWHVDLTEVKLLKERKGMPGGVVGLRPYDNDGHDWIVSVDGANGGGFIGRISTIQQQRTQWFPQQRALTALHPMSNCADTLQYSRLSQIIDFDCAPSRHFDWANIVSVHRGSFRVYLWSGHDACLVPRCLDVPRHRVDTAKQLVSRESTRKSLPTAAAFSACGNYVIVGYEDGSLLRYAVQSGILRGRFQQHDSTGSIGPVVSIKVHHSGEVLTLNSRESFIRRWDLQRMKAQTTSAIKVTVDEELKFLYGFEVLGPFVAVVLSNVERESPQKEFLQHHNPSGDPTYSYRILLLDYVSGREIRTFPTFTSASAPFLSVSPDARWLCHTEGRQLLVYDILSTTLIDWIEFEDDIAATAFYPTNAHFLVSFKSIFPGGGLLLANRHLFDISTSQLILKANVRSRGPIKLGLAQVSGVQCEEPAQISEVTEFLSSVDLEKPIEKDMLVTSGVGSGKIQALWHLELIKERSKPRASEVEKPLDVPFFLPTTMTSGKLQFLPQDPTAEQLAEEETAPSGTETAATLGDVHLTDAGLPAVRTSEEEWQTVLQRPDALAHILELEHVKVENNVEELSGVFSRITLWLKDLSPSSVHMLIHELGPDAGRPTEDFTRVLNYFTHEIQCRQNCDVVQALLHVFFEAHNQTLISNSLPSSVSVQLGVLREFLKSDWSGLELQCQQLECFLKYLTLLQIE